MPEIEALTIVVAIAVILLMLVGASVIIMLAASAVMDLFNWIIWRWNQRGNHE